MPSLFILNVDFLIISYIFVTYDERKYLRKHIFIAENVVESYWLHPSRIGLGARTFTHNHPNPSGNTPLGLELGWNEVVINDSMIV